MFEFPEYFAALRHHAARVGPPRAVLVASDSEDTAAAVADACGPPAQRAWWADEEGSDTSQTDDDETADNVKPVCVFTAEASERFRAEHGAHVVAADGGCRPVTVPNADGTGSSEKVRATTFHPIPSFTLLFHLSPTPSPSPS